MYLFIIHVGLTTNQNQIKITMSTGIIQPITNPHVNVSTTNLKRCCKDLKYNDIQFRQYEFKQRKRKKK